MTHLCISELGVIIGSGNGLSFVCCQDIEPMLSFLSIGLLGIKFIEIWWIKMLKFAFKKIYLNMLAILFRH